jgi:hypothetical protein
MICLRQGQADGLNGRLARASCFRLAAYMDIRKEDQVPADASDTYVTITATVLQDQSLIIHQRVSYRPSVVRAVCNNEKTCESAFFKYERSVVDA